jgi:radical SAM superfamily enzyme YgiQ (UPF0313 family)
MRTYLLNPTLKDQAPHIREGRCMQKASSWATAWPPLTLALLGAMAREWGPVRLFDGNVERWTLDELLRDIAAFGADLVVVNTGFPSIDGDMAVAAAVKQARPAARVAAFGVFFTMLEKAGFEPYPALDYGLVGEPEETFREIGAALAAGRTDVSAISGLLFRDAQGAIRQTAARGLLHDLDSLPLPDRSLLKNDRYRLPHNNRPFTLVNTARGCPYSCTYCIVNAYYGRGSRRRSIPSIIAEIRECVDRYGIREFLFWEEVFTLDREYVLAFCRAIEEAGLKIRWAATTRLDRVSADLLAAMKKAGCYLIGLGIESGDQAILDRARKNQRVEDAHRVVALCRQAGIRTMGHFIFGLPGETRETAEATIRFMLRLGLDYMQCYAAVPYPKTELGDLAVQEGWIAANRWSQYDFGGASIMRTDTLSPAEVDRFRTLAFRRFYFRPGYLLRRLLLDAPIRHLLRVSAFLDWMKQARPAPKGKAA